MSESPDKTKISPEQLLTQQHQLAPIQETVSTSIEMQSVSAQQTIIPQASPQQVQTVAGTAMTQVMTQGPQPTASPHGVATNLPLPPQSAQFYVQASVGTGMQGPPAIAPAPGPQATTTTVSALHQPMQHHLAPQPLNHPGVSQSPMTQLQPQVQVIQGGIPGGSYFHQVYQNAQGQYIMPSNLTLQPAPGMNPAQLHPGAINPLNNSIQVIAAGKPFQGQITPQMIAAAGGKGVIQPGNQTGYNHANIPTSGNQAVLISQLGGNPTLGVISNQPTNILPAQSAGPKPGEMQKVNNMSTAAFSQIPQGITWASPAGTLHSPTLLAQNSSIFLRGTHPGQENVFIQNSHAHSMVNSNSMINPIAMPTTPQPKLRTGVEAQQANIQPKSALMRPAILPSMTTAQLRHGASVSTQTAAGQPIAPQLVPRSQAGKMRGKNAIARAPPPAIAMQQQQLIQAPQQVMQQHTMGGMTMTAAPMTMATIQPTAPGSVGMVTMASVNMTHSGAKPITVAGNLQQAKPLTALQTHGNMLAPQLNVMGQVQNMVLNKMGQMQPPVMSAAIPIQQQPQPQPAVIAPMSQAEAQQSITFQQQQPLIAAVQQPQVQAVHPQGQVSLTPTPPIQPPTVADRPAEAKVEKKQATCPSPPENVPRVATPTKPQNTITMTASTNDGTDSNKSKNVQNGVAMDKTSTNSNVGPPKAMVKPQVLTHVIEGFVIQEACEPFPVSRAARITDAAKLRANTNSSNLATVAPQAPLEKQTVSEEFLKKDLNTSPKDMVQCEVCCKFESRIKFKKFKRFCSAACNKRFTSGNMLKRPGDYADHGRKRFKDEDIGSEGGGKMTTEQQLTDADGDIEMQPAGQEDSMDGSKIPRSDILKWTVSEVVDFIRNLPGCQDYAEDFELQEIDGQALMLLKADHLMSAMSIKLGPALKICDKINIIRSDKKEEG